MSKLVVAGDMRLTLPFTAIGFEPVSAADADELASALDRLAVDKSVALVVCGESQAENCPEAVARFRREAHAVLLVVPDGTQPKRLGYEELRRAVERAAGVDLLRKTSVK